MVDNDRENPRDGARLRRRLFVAGVGSLGVGGVAGCLGDGDDGAAGTPTRTGEPPDTATDTETGTRTQTRTRTATPSGGEEFEPLLSDLTYEYYEGSFSGMPNFDERTPVASDTLEGGPLSTSYAQREENFALVFEGEFPIGSRLLSGEYTVAADPDDALRLFLGGRKAMEVTAETAPQERALFLQDGSREFRIEYVHSTGASRIGLGWRGTFGELLPRISETDPMREALGVPMQYQGPTGPSLETEVGTRPAVKWIKMPTSGDGGGGGRSPPGLTKAVAVGLPDLTNYCFDMRTGGLKYAWYGSFINYGPIISFGEGRGDGPARLLGKLFPVGAVDYPVRIGDPDAEPTVEFGGCREAPHPPELRYGVDGHGLTHTVEGLSGTLGLRHTFAFEDVPSERVYFHTADENITREASDGEWSGGTLEVPAGIAEFSVTITAREVQQ
jgi:hypothetical protein